MAHDYQGSSPSLLELEGLIFWMRNEGQMNPPQNVAVFTVCPKRRDWLQVPLPHNPHAQGVFNIRCLHPHWPSPVTVSRNHALIHCCFQTTVTLDMPKVSQLPGRRAVYEPVYSNAQVRQFLPTVHVISCWLSCLFTALCPVHN